MPLVGRSDAEKRPVASAWTSSWASVPPSKVSESPNSLSVTQVMTARVTLRHFREAGALVGCVSSHQGS